MSYFTTIHQAARDGNDARLSSLLNNDGVDVNEKDNSDRTAISYASQWGHRECVELLITKGADPNVKDRNGQTALMWASRNGHRECMSLLITKGGAGLNVKDDHGDTALMVASREGRRECTELLVTKGADRTVMNVDGQTAADLEVEAAIHSANESLEASVRFNSDVRCKLEARVTALEAELAEERRALAAEQSARELEREKWGIETCMICHDRATDTRFLECAHSCACDHCAADLRERGATCPLCRSVIRDVRALVIRAEIRDAAEEASGEPPRRRRRRR